MFDDVAKPDQYTRGDALAPGPDGAMVRKLPASSFRTFLKMEKERRDPRILDEQS